MGILENKTIVITGSSRGLGLAIARVCAEEGAAVVLSSRSAGAVERAVSELRSAGHRAAGQACDVSKLEQVEALGAFAAQAFGGFDVWINNAGVSAPFGPTAHVPPADFVAVVNTNILGTYHGSLVALRRFYPRGEGKLINILGRGDTGSVPNQNAYTSSKIWVRSFTKALAAEYRGSGIGVFAYNPGLMITEFLTDVAAVAGFEDRLQRLVPVMRMWGNPPDVPARHIAWLASAATNGKTGLVQRQISPAHLLLGALREGARVLLGRPAPEIDFKVRVVTPAIPFTSQDRSSGLQSAPGENRA